MASGKRVLVLHLAGQYPLGGVGWQAVHHVVALDRLGYEVYYVEDSGAPPYDPGLRSVVEDPSGNVDFVRRLMERFGLGDRWVYVDADRGAVHGLAPRRLADLYAGADALVNVCGATRLREEHLRCPVRIYLETDPVYEQVKLADGDEVTAEFLAAHTHHVTYGENLGAPDCPVPLEKFTWRRTRPPVVLDLWDPDRPPGPRFTTVGTWQNVGKDVVFRGERYSWSKHVNFLRVLDLPARSPAQLELAVENCDAEARERLTAHGWHVRDAWEVSRDLDAYQRYVYGSRGELTVAKDLVVRTRSGWFSDRSAAYLAAGRPVVTQDTGFGKVLPTGRGLFAFSTPDEALAALEAIEGDYRRHAAAAREIAVEYFDARRLLGAILEDAGL